MAITVRELVTKLTIGGNATDKLAKFGLAMNGVKAGLSIMTGAVKAASRVTFGLVDDVTKLGDSVAKTARQVGVTAKEFQRLSFAADRSGVPLVNLRKGLQNIERNLRDAAIAAGKGQKNSFSTALAEVGLELKDLQGLDAEEKIGLLGEALSQVADEGKRVALSQKLVGEEAGPRFASLLAEGTEGIKALGDEAERLGLVLGDDALKSSEAFQDSLTNARAVFQGVKNTVALQLLPTVDKAVNKIKDWTLANKEVIGQKFELVVAAIARGIEFLLENVGELTKAFSDIVSVGMELVRMFLTFSKSVGGVDKALKLAIAGLVTFKIAMLSAGAASTLALGPIGVLAVALAGLAFAFHEVESAADLAAKAQARVGVGKNETDKLDKEQARKDAVSVANAIQGGTVLPASVRKRLIGGGARQFEKTLANAQSLTLNGQRGGGVSSTLSRKRKLSILQSLREDLAEERRFRASRRAQSEPEAERVGTLGFLGLDNDLPLPDVDGRSFSPISSGETAKGPSTDELIANAIKSGSLPEEAALLASSQPPIIIPITNNTITVNVDAPTTIDGASSDNAEDFRQIAREEFDGGIGEVLREAMDEIRPQLAR